MQTHPILSLTLIAALPYLSGPARAESPPQAGDGAPVVAAIDDSSTDLLLSWNERVIAIAVAEDGLLTLKGVHTASMMHLAVHDALNAIRPLYSRYAFDGGAPDADPIAAAAQAAFEVAVDQYPGERPQLAAERDRWLERVAEGPSKASAIALGRAAAAAILEAREGDRWNGQAEYAWQPMAPGVYAEFREHSGTPEGFVFGAGWAAAKPFMLTAQDQFRAPPPPAISSDEYAEAYAEVKEVGRFESPSRTPDQTHLALWWKDFAERSHNRLARQLVAAEQMDLWYAARTFALLDMSVYDAYVSVFENKFFYNHWRPYTAIRWTADDGNPRTEPDPQWNNLHRHTYAFPSYPSAHGTACAAAMTILAKTFGDDYPFTMTTAEVDSAGPMSAKMKLDPPTRSFTSFSSAALECALSRVYLGIHFRYDSIAGNELGRQIGSYAWESFLTPLR